MLTLSRPPGLVQFVRLSAVWRRGLSLVTLKRSSWRRRTPGEALGLADARNLAVVELVEHPRVHGGDLLHAQVDGVEAALQPVEQEPGHPRGDGRGVGGLRQPGQVQPLAT